MRVHWLQHAEFEGLGCIASWLEENLHPVRGTRLHDGDAVPALDDFDVLIVMGGPMNIDEHDRHSWLVAEKELIRAAIDGGKRVLGICLGAQLVADVLGGPVTRNPEIEIGWFPLRLTPEGRTHPLLRGLPDPFIAFHWHGDTYALPQGAVLLATSDACAQQAFAWDGSRVLGLQFHLEVTQADACEWFRTDAVVPSAYVQPPERILADAKAFDANNDAMRQVLRRFFS